MNYRLLIICLLCLFSFQLYANNPVEVNGQKYWFENHGDNNANDLVVTAMIDHTDTENGRLLWRVRNTSGVEMTVDWAIYGSSTGNTVTIPAGQQVVFWTDMVPGDNQNTLVVDWGNVRVEKASGLNNYTFPPQAIPIDGGLSFLLFGGITLGIRNFMKKRKMA